jgi:hypothetical protein
MMLSEMGTGGLYVSNTDTSANLALNHARRAKHEKRGIEMKLYWRLKIKGKWTWRPCRYITQEEDAGFLYVAIDIPDEEE